MKLIADFTVQIYNKEYRHFHLFDTEKPFENKPIPLCGGTQAEGGWVIRDADIDCYISHFRGMEEFLIFLHGLKAKIVKIELQEQP